MRCGKDVYKMLKVCASLDQIWPGYSPIKCHRSEWSFGFDGEGKVEVQMSHIDQMVR